MDVPERTLRFWIAKGVLEPPIRKPYKHSDGRKKYFPTRVVGEITELLKLQKEGWKLTQIKKRLRESARAGQSEGINQEQLAKLLLDDYLAHGEFRDRQRNVDGADPSTPDWRRVRNFLVARLTHFVGRKQAVRSVTSFMVGLSGREMKKLLRRANLRSVNEHSPQESEWTAFRDRMATALAEFKAPDWGEGESSEPILSLRVRECVGRLSSLLAQGPSARDELDSALAELNSLRREVGLSLDFLLR